jgi:hypothetical protein
MNFEANLFIRNFNKLTVAKFSCKSAAGVRCRRELLFFPFLSRQLRRTTSIGAKQGK